MEGVSVPQLDLNLEEDPNKTKDCLGLLGSSGFGFFMSPMHASVAPAGVPLIVKMPDGGNRQLEVPHTATVRDLKTKVLEETAAATPGLTMQNINMSFGEAGLMDDDALLSKYNIPSAYENAGSLLWTIDESQIDHERKAEAVGVTADVIKGITAGISSTDGVIEGQDWRPLRTPVPPLPHELVIPGNPPVRPVEPPAHPPTTNPPNTVSGCINPTHLIPKLADMMPTHFTREASQTWASAYKSGTPVPPPSAGVRTNAMGSTLPLGARSQAVNHASGGNWLEDLSKTWEKEYRQPEADDSGGEECEDDDGSCDDEYSNEKANGQNEEKALFGPSKKKRGRKRKYPNMSEDDRKDLRKQQNRESARKSRAKKKEISAEYDDKMEVLKKQNDHLKDEVGDLKQKLAFLQQLLTVKATYADAKKPL